MTVTYALNVTYTVKPGQREEYLSALAANGLREKVLAEEGCVQYDYFLPVHHPDQVLLLEKWASPESQQAHVKQPHMAVLAGLKERYVECTDIERYPL